MSLKRKISTPAVQCTVQCTVPVAPTVDPQADVTLASPHIQSTGVQTDVVFVSVYRPEMDFIQGDFFNWSPPKFSKYKSIYNLWHLEKFQASLHGILYLENLGGSS